MIDALGLFILWRLFGCGSGGGGGGAWTPPQQPALPGGQPGWPGSPIALPPSTGTKTSSPPWPQAVPTDLPKFPGPSWEFDEPPPPAVQQRAGQLVSSLWAQGSGAYRVERTAGRWIAYQAQVVASGKRGVVAYRMKRPAALPSGAVATNRQRPTVAPSSPPAASTPPSARPPAASPSPNVSTVSPLHLPVLRRGAGIKPQAPSNDVRLLQQRLGIAADGQFGRDTENAVRAFQLRKGLAVDGIVGERTWSALFAVAA